MSLPPLSTSARRRALGGLVLNGFLQAAASLGLVLVFGAAVSAEPGITQRRAILVAASVGLGLVIFALRVLQRRQGEAFALDYVRDTRLAFVDRLFAGSTDESRTRLGLLMTRLITDLSAIKLWLANGLASMFVAVPSTTLVLSGAFWLVPSVAPFLVVGVVVWFVVTVVANPFLRRAVRESRRHRGRLASRVGDAVLARSTLAHFGRAGATRRRVEKMSDRLNRMLVARAGWSGAMRAAAELITPTMIAAMTAAAFLAMPEPGAADVSMLLLLAGLVVVQLTDIARAADYRLAYLESRRRLASVLAAPALPEPTNPVPFSRSADGRSIRVEIAGNADDQPFAFEAPPGSVVLFAGKSRLARSAIVLQIGGLEKAENVSVDLDGVPFDQISLRDRRRAITVVSPAIPLIRGTIEQNIAIGAPSESSPEEIATIAALCGLCNDAAIGHVPLQHSIEAPLTIDPPLAVRIRAARALARSASILLVDDPFLLDSAILPDFLDYARRKRMTVILSGEAGAVRGVDIVWSLDPVDAAGRVRRLG